MTLEGGELAGDGARRELRVSMGRSWWAQPPRERPHFQREAERPCLVP